MFNTTFSLLTLLVAIPVSVIITWAISNLWFKNHYINHKEMVTLQGSHRLIQQQYGVLAERIKLTDIQLAETKAKLDQKSMEFIQANNNAVRCKAEFENAERSIKEITTKLEECRKKIEAEVEVNTLIQKKLTLAEYNLKTAEEKLKVRVTGDFETNDLKQLIDGMNQNIHEFKNDFGKNFGKTTAQQTEISNQIWQMIELNKKLTEDAEKLTQFISGQALLGRKNSERHFTLTSIPKSG